LLDEDKGKEIEEDPDFVSRDRLFAESDDLENIEGDLTEIPPAFDELFAMLTFMYLQVQHSARRLMHNARITL
jgi:hypothetical protein